MAATMAGVLLIMRAPAGAVGSGADLAQVLAAGATGVLVFGGAVLLLRMEEATMLAGTLRRRRP
jgi:hypothetical protein